MELIIYIYIVNGDKEIPTLVGMMKKKMYGLIIFPYNHFNQK